MGARYPYYLLADSPEGQRKEAEVTRTPPKSAPTHGDLRLGFVYERVPHITLKSIANNADPIVPRQTPSCRSRRLDRARGRLGRWSSADSVESLTDLFALHTSCRMQTPQSLYPFKVNR